MARTIDSTIQTPRTTAIARAEIYDSVSDGGQYQVGVAANTLYEQHRHPLWVQSAQYRGLPQAVGDVARVRVKTCPQRGGTQRCDVAISVYTSGSGTAQITIGETGGSSSSMTIGTGGTVRYTTTLTVTDTTETIDLYLEIDSSTWTDCEVRSVSVYYDRGSAQVASGIGDDDVVGIEATALAGERPVSAARTLDICHIVRRVYTRGHQAIAMAALDGALTGPGSLAVGYNRCYIPVPTTIDGQDLTLTVAAYGGSSAWSADVVTEYDEDTLSPSAGAWDEIELTIPSVRSGEALPRMLEVLVDTAGYFESLCAWWSDAEYPG